MKKHRTFVDAGVLIAAACGFPNLSDKAFEILDDPSRDLIVSDFVRLEFIPKPHFHAHTHEIAFYESAFASAKRIVRSSSSLVAEAQQEAERAGLSAIDALHVAAAKRSKCPELVTTEKPTKPLFRAKGLTVTTIR